MTIQEIMDNPNNWQDVEVTVLYNGKESEKFTLCSDDEGYYLLSASGIIVRHTSELGKDFDRMSIEIVA